MQSVLEQWQEVLTLKDEQPWFSSISNRRRGTAELEGQAETKGPQQSSARRAPSGLGDAPACPPSMGSCSDCRGEDFDAAAGMCSACMECRKAAPQAACADGPLLLPPTAREVIEAAMTAGGLRGGGNAAATAKPSGGAMAVGGIRGGGKDRDLYNAAKRGDLAEVKRLLRSGKNIMWVDEDGRSCLYVASWKNHLEVTKYLVEVGGRELLMKTKTGALSCLHIAAQQGNLEIAQHLAEVGRRELLMKTDEGGSSCLYIAAQNGHLAVAKYLAEAGGQELLMKSRDNGASCLYIAVQQGKLEVAKYLAKVGGRELLMKTREGGYSCLFVAAEKGNLGMTQHLAEVGGRELLMKTDKDGTSCLLIAAERGHLEITKFLAEAGGRELLMKTNKSDASCLDKAAAGGHMIIFEALVDAGGLELLLAPGELEGPSQAERDEEAGYQPQASRRHGTSHAQGSSAGGGAIHSRIQMAPKAISSLGVNSTESTAALRRLHATMDQRAPMKVILFRKFETLGKIPRSSDGVTVPLAHLPADVKLIFVSHRWLRPSVDPKLAHPDDAKGSKHNILCSAVRQLATRMGWPLDRVCLWVDYCGIEQDDTDLKMAGVDSILAYAAACDALLIPSPEAPAENARTVDKVPGGYGERAWTRLESEAFFLICYIKQVQAPNIWVAAFGGKGGLFLERFEYELTELASKGILFAESDRATIRAREEELLDTMRKYNESNGYVAKHDAAVVGVAFLEHHGGGVVVSIDSKARVQLVDKEMGIVKTQRSLAQGEVEGRHEAAFTRNGSLVAVGAGGGDTVEVWDVAAGKSKGSFVRRGKEIWCMALSSEGSMIAACDNGGGLAVWDVSSPAIEKCSWKTGLPSIVQCLAFSPNSKAIACACPSSARTVVVIDIASGSEECCLSQSGGSRCMCMSWVGRCSTLAVGGWSSEAVCVWELCGKDAKLKFRLEHHFKVSCMAVSPDARWMVCGHGNRLTMWDLSTGREADTRLRCGHASDVTSVSFSADGRSIVSGGADRSVRVLDSSTGTGAEGRSRGHSKLVYCVEFSSDGDVVASAGADGAVKVWNFAAGEVVHVLRGDESRWPAGVDAEVKALAQRVRTRTSPAQVTSGSFHVSFKEQELLIKMNMGRQRPDGGDDVRRYDAPSFIVCSCCARDRICLGLCDGQVLFLEAPFMLLPHEQWLDAHEEQQADARAKALEEQKGEHVKGDTSALPLAHKRSRLKILAPLPARVVPDGRVNGTKEVQHGITVTNRDPRSRALAPLPPPSQ